jgi:predicted metallo-beta-lactamase superfamily hydrolase
MKVRFLAADSFGVRSMATLVETSDVSIGIDLWASLGPSRYGLPPHELELLALEEARKTLSEVGKTVDIHVITHYHYDHHCPDCNFYEGKRLLVKDWREFINASQRKRFSRFRWKDVAEPADGRTFLFGGTKVEFSPPVPHGEPNTRLGYVIMVYVEEDL